MNKNEWSDSVLMMSKYRQITNNTAKQRRVSSNNSGKMFTIQKVFLILVLIETITNQKRSNAFSYPTFIANKHYTSFHSKHQQPNNVKSPWFNIPKHRKEGLKSKNTPESEENRISSMTVPELKQQLRLRGLKVSGKKNELVQRLLECIQSDDDDIDTQKMDDDKVKEFYKEHGKELIDVSEYIKDEVDKSVKSTKFKPKEKKEEDDETELWGEEARVLYENDDTPVVDNLSRTIIEYKSKIPFNNKDKIKAYVVASREALKGYLSGGGSKKAKSIKDESIEKVKEIQMKREKENQIPMVIRREELNNENLMGIAYDPDEPDADKDGRYRNLNRDYTDWGVYTTTGAQISASEVEGILVLSDVYGPFSDNNKLLCDRIAFECQPCVVMSPDLFRDTPWNDDDKKDYEEWRSMHSEERVSIDIRSSANMLKEQYGISSIAVFGMCFGGGRALEVAADYIPPNSRYYDVPMVHPKACVAWYPTRYDKHVLFGNDNNQDKNKVAIMALFAEKDTIPGATKQDAEELKYLLENNNNDNIIDYMIKVYPNQEHGFAHQEEVQTTTSLSNYDDAMDDYNMGRSDDQLSTPEKESAFLLSTAWIETYTRLFLPTVGTPIKEDSEWSTNIEMKDLNYFHDYYDDDSDFDENMNMNIRDKIRSKIEKEIQDHRIEDDDLDYSDVRMQQW